MYNRRGWRVGWINVAHVGGGSCDGEGDGWVGGCSVDWDTESMGQLGED